MLGSGMKQPYVCMCFDLLALAYLFVCIIVRTCYHERLCMYVQRACARECGKRRWHAGHNAVPQLRTLKPTQTAFASAPERNVTIPQISPALLPATE